MISSKQIVLASYAQGLPCHDNVKSQIILVQLSTDKPIMLKLRYLSVDPYMRNRLNKINAPYISRLELGEPIISMAVAEVIESRTNTFKVGDYVIGMLPWQEYVSCNQTEISKLPFSDIPLSYYLGIMGMPGLTAHVGMNILAKPKPGDTVFVSTAAGAVGHIAVQLAKKREANIVAATGNNLKKEFLKKDLGCKTVINYNDFNSWDDYREHISSICPQGIDINFENAGGANLQEILKLIKNGGKLIVCGLISQYNQTNPRQGPSNFHLIQENKIAIKDFIVNDYPSELYQYQTMIYELLQSDSIITKETIYLGIENAWHALIDLFHGKNTGKMIVKI